MVSSALATLVSQLDTRVDSDRRHPHRRMNLMSLKGSVCVGREVVFCFLFFVFCFLFFGYWLVVVCGHSEV